MAAPSIEDPLGWARERFSVPGHPLALTLPYADESLRDALASLHALIGEIAAVPGDVSDPAVARRKLAWWREALAEGLPHPAVQAWRLGGGASRVPADEFEPLFRAVAAEIEPPRFELVDEFRSHCRAVAAPAAALEHALVDPGGEAGRDAFEAMAEAGYRIRVVRDLVLDACQQRWLVPLEWQAEFRVTRQEVAAGEGGRRLEALIRHAAGDAVLALDAAIDGVEPRHAWLHRHALLRAHVDRRLGRLLVQRPGRAARERVAPGGLMDAWSVWRYARRLRRAAAQS